jgi:hypothetical protein
MRLRKTFLAALLFILGLAVTSRAQYYFGQNKIQYTKFDWQVLTTEHYNIYFYPEEKDVAEAAAKLAEESYEYLQEKFNHTIDKKIPFIVYSSPVFFEQTNIVPGILPENVAGFTEFFKQRVVIPFNGSYSDFAHVVRHEIVHVFTMQKISYVAKMHRKNNIPRPPLWFTEGIAEYWSSGWDSQADMMMRDMTISGRIMSIDNLYSISGSFLMYKVGQSILNYLGETYGDDKLSDLFDNWWKARTFSNVVEITYGKSLDEIGSEWEYWLRKRYYPYIENQELPDRVAEKLTRDGYNIKPTVFLKDTRDGRKEYIGFKTYRMGYSSIAAMPLDGEASDYTTLVKGGRSEQHESLHFIDSGLDGNLNGLIAFASKSQESDALNIYDTKRGKVIRKAKFDSLIAISSPSWSGDGTRIVFEGTTKSGRSDLYLYDFDGEELTRLTNDIYVDKTPAFSHTDGLIAFSSDRSFSGKDGSRNLFLYDLGTGEIRQLTYGKQIDESPRFTRSGDRIIFTSDRAGGMNLFVIDGVTNGNRQTLQMTNFVTGVFDPILAEYDSTVIFAAYQNFGFHIYKMDMPESPLDVTGHHSTDDNFDSATWSMARLEGELSEGSARYKTQFSFDIAQSAVAYDPIVGTMGGLQFALTDILGNHQYYFLLYNTADTREDFVKSINAGATYINKTHRINFGGGLFHFYNEYSERYYGYVGERNYGGFLTGSYPVSRYRRFESSLFLRALEKDTTFSTGHPLKATTAMWTLSYIKDTSIWDPTGPIDGIRLNIGMSQSIDIVDMKYFNSTYNIDFRKYFRLGKSSAYAARLMYLKSVGRDKQRYYLGGSWSLRGYERREFYANNLLLINNELRFPLVNDLLISFPIGNVRFQAIRGALFFDIGNSWEDFKSSETDPDLGSNGVIGSFGFGIRVSLGYVTVLRFDFSRKTDFESVTNSYDFDFFFGWNF